MHCIERVVFQANNDFKKHTQNVVEMKRDLESIFKRLKIIKQKLNKQMPEAYNHVIGPKETVKEEDDEYDVAIKERKQLEAATLGEQSTILTASDITKTDLEQGEDVLSAEREQELTNKP